ncbi:uncharacterized protein LOC128710048 [Anopheles marshallii]|uniref:uncharacterized protein LOC128710048 n=1 Tax=Anopheles marshallii TaxID=1521116 RepID=UPI00237B82F9|nr:uncharacterized protein LOC128710048 [Anopheles marshallii]
MLRYCFRFLYYFHSIMGLNPFGINDRYTVQRSKLKRRWTLTIGCAIAILVCFSYGSILSGGSASSGTYVDLILIRSLVLVEFFIRYCSVVVCFYQILTNEANLHRYIHRFIAIVQSVRCSQSYGLIPRMVYILIAKILIVDIGLCTLFAVNYGINNPNAYINGYRTVNIYVVMIGAQITNVVLLMLLFSSHTYAQINNQLDRTVRRMLCFETEGCYWGRRRVLQQQICCDASDTIDRHCALHQEFTEIIHRLISIFQILIALINLNQFVVIVSRIYFIYITKAQSDSDFISYHRLYNSILYTCFEVIQCILLAVGSSVVTKEARMPGIILNLFIDAPLDIRAERSIETFSLVMLGTDLRIKIAGLYVLRLVFLFLALARHNGLHVSHRVDTISTEQLLAVEVLRYVKVVLVEVLENSITITLSVQYKMVQFSLNYVFVVVLYLQVLFDPSTLLQVLNELIECARAVLRYTYTSGEFTVGRRLLFKALAIDVLQSFSWYGIFIWLQRMFGLSYMLAFGLNAMAVMQIVSATNILLAVLLWGAFLYRLINERVQIIIENLVQMGDPAQLRDTANPERRIVFNHIYRQLGILRAHHNALTNCIQNIVQFYEVPLALAMLYQFFIIISERAVHRILAVSLYWTV